MAKNIKDEAAKAITKLVRQRDSRQANGQLRDAVKDEVRHFTGRLAYDLNGDPH